MASSLSSPLYYKQIEYTDEKGRTKTKKDKSVVPVLYAKLIYSEKSGKILSLFSTKGKKDVDPLTILFNIAKSKWILIIESIFISKNLSNQENQYYLSKKVTTKTKKKVKMRKFKIYIFQMLKKKKIKLNFGSITAKFTNFGEQIANFRSKRKFGEIFGASL